MATMAKILIAAALAAGVGGGVTFAQAGDVRGPCDEAEHRNDPRCAAGAAQAREDRAEPNDRQGRKRNRGSNRGHAGKSGHSGSGRSGRSGSGSSGPG
jgi:hypothetical protein